MADKYGTTPKQNYQLNWDRGETSGDVGNGFVKELRNLEMDEPGVLRTRDVFELLSAEGTLNGSTVFIQSAGSKYIISVRAVVLGLAGTLSITIVDPDDGSVVSTISEPFASPISGADVDRSDISLDVYNDSVVIGIGAGVNKMFVLSNVTNGQFLSLPPYLDGTEEYYSEMFIETSSAEGWSLRELVRYKPRTIGWNLKKNITTTEEDGTTSTRPFTFTDKHDMTTQIASAMQNDGVDAAIIYNLENDDMDFREHLIPSSFIYNYYVQFEYVSGSSSSLSDPVTVIGDTGDVDVKQSCNITLAVNPSSMVGVKNIRVFRKIIGGDYETLDVSPSLFFTAPVSQQEIESRSEEISFGEEYRFLGSNINHQQIDSDDYASYEGAGAGEYPYKIIVDDVQIVDRAYGAGGGVLEQNDHNMFTFYTSTPSTVYRCHGWYSPDGIIAMYMPEHYGYKADDLEIQPFRSKVLGFKVFDSVVASEFFNGTIISGTRALLSSSINGGGYYQVSQSYYDQEYHKIYIPSAGDLVGSPYVESVFHCTMKIAGESDYMGMSAMHGVSSFSPDQADTFANYVPFTCADQIIMAMRSYASTTEAFDVPAYSPDPLASDVEEHITLLAPDSFGIICKIDNGEPLALGYEQVNGVAESDEVEVSAGAVLVNNGRLFAGNVVSDGVDIAYRLAYSTFRSIDTFASYGYIDYARASADEVRALAKHDDLIAVITDSSCSVVDVSSGSDVGWKSFAEFPGKGIINSSAFTSTPFGIFWADAQGVYSVNRRGFNEVSEEVGKDYRERVKAVSANGESIKDIRVLYREKLKQILVSFPGAVVDGVYSSVPFSMVLDLDTGAWHSHVYDELGSESSLYGLINTGGASDNEVSITGNVINSVVRPEDASLVDPTRYTPDIVIDTGEFHVGVPEIIKKLKRVYVHYRNNDDDDHVVDLTVSGDGGGEVTPSFVADGGGESGVERISASTRGYKNRIRIVKSGELGGKPCDMRIDSVGVSFKPKKLK